MLPNDKELLELAAKAAGWLGKEGCYPVYTKDGRIRPWNPLTDDGDALRLAVKLGLAISIDDAPACESYASRYDVMSGMVEPHNADAYAATRRAIVRAAAEIGKQKE